MLPTGLLPDGGGQETGLEEGQPPPRRPPDLPQLPPLESRQGPGGRKPRFPRQPSSRQARTQPLPQPEPGLEALLWESFPQHTHLQLTGKRFAAVCLVF